SRVGGSRRGATSSFRRATEFPAHREVTPMIAFVASHSGEQRAKLNFATGRRAASGERVKGMNLEIKRMLTVCNDVELCRAGFNLDAIDAFAKQVDDGGAEQREVGWPDILSQFCRRFGQQYQDLRFATSDP